MSKNELKSTSLRMPVKLLSWVEGEAEKEHRSITGQIIHILSQAKDAKKESKK